MTWAIVAASDQHVPFSISDTALQHLAELRKLDISGNKEIGGGFKDATVHLASLKNLEVLDLHQCCVTEEDMTVLCKDMLRKSVKHVDFLTSENISKVLRCSAWLSLAELGSFSWGSSGSAVWRIAFSINMECIFAVSKEIS